MSVHINTSSAYNGNGSHPSREQILAGLDLRAEAEALGIRFTGKVFPSGYAECYRLDGDDNHPSAGFHLAKGRYNAFSGPDGPNGDGSESIIDLHARRKGCSISDSLRHYAERARLATDRPPVKKPAGRPPVSYPTLEAAIERCRDSIAWREKIDHQIALSDGYEHANGDIAFHIVRIEACEIEEGRTKPRKHIRPFRKNSDGRWVQQGYEGVRPIFRLPKVLAHRGPVYVVEGEPCVHTLESLGLVGTTSAHGSKSAHQTDWTTLAGRDVVILPDNDSEGRSYAVKIKELLSQCQPPARVKVVELPGLDPKDDLVDWVRCRRSQGTTDDQIRAELLQIVEVAVPNVTEGISDNNVISDSEFTSQTALPEVIISTAEHVTIDAAVAALARHDNVYQRSFMLVHVLRDASKRGIVRPEGTPTVRPMPQPLVRKHMTMTAKWLRPKENDKGEIVLVPAHPPEWANSAVYHQGSWPGVRHLEAVTETPVLRADGTILDVPGYDEATGLLYVPNCEFPAIPVHPTIEDVRVAVARLFEIVADFPFAHMIEEKNGHVTKDDAGASYRGGWLAALLTPFARFAIDGPCPMFLFDANASGSGKTKLCDVISVASTGRPMPRTNYSDSDDEMSKQILSVALAADRMILLDNVPTGASIGGPSLDRALTATTVSGRILGQSKMSGELPLLTVFYATGNNLGLKGDALRRIVPIRLESPEDNPEQRSDFKIQGDLLKHVEQNRGRVVADILTILRGFFVAGKPKTQKLTPMDYVAWCDVVRYAVLWATGSDPCEGRRESIANDDATVSLSTLLEGWQRLCRVAGRASLTSAQAVETLTANASDSELSAIRATLSEWSKDGGLPPPRTIGNRLAKIRGKSCKGKSLQFSIIDGNKSWYVRSLSGTTPEPSGSSGSSGSSSNSIVSDSRTIENIKGPENSYGTGLNQSHLSHLSHSQADDWQEEEL